MVCLIKAYRLMPPFGKWLTAPVVCLSVCVYPSPHQYIPSPLCLRLHCMSPSLSQTKTNRALWSLHTHIPATHPPINTHTMHIFHSHTPTPPTHPLSDVHLARKNETYIRARTHKQMHTHKKSMPLAHTLSFLSAFSHECTDIKHMCLQKWKWKRGSNSEEKVAEHTSTHACMHTGSFRHSVPSRSNNFFHFSFADWLCKTPRHTFPFFKAVLNNPVQISVQISWSHPIVLRLRLDAVS